MKLSEVAALYELAEQWKGDRILVEHPVIEKFSAAVSRLLGALGDDQQEDFWAGLTRPLKHLRWLLGVPPVRWTGGTPPNAKMLAELDVAGAAEPSWRKRHVLQAADLQLSGELSDIEDLKLRGELERSHAGLLASHHMKHLDISEIRSRSRVVTQTIGRHLYEHGYAGVAFKSNLDGKPCAALFDGRTELVAIGEPQLISEDSKSCARCARGSACASRAHEHTWEVCLTEAPIGGLAYRNRRVEGLSDRFAMRMAGRLAWTPPHRPTRSSSGDRSRSRSVSNADAAR